MALTSTSVSPAATAAAAPTPAPVDINSVVGGLVDRRPWQYWDTFRWNLASPVIALPTEVALFTVPINQLDIYTQLRKTKLDTNMTASGQFTAPDCLILQQIGIYLCEGNQKVAIDQFFENCYMEFRINQKIFWEGQPWQFPAGVGYMGHAAVANTTDQFWTNGFPAPQATRRAGKFSKYIAPLQPFSLKFIFPGTPPTIATNLKLVVFLDGLSDTSVQ